MAAASKLAYMCLDAKLNFSVHSRVLFPFTVLGLT